MNPSEIVETPTRLRSSLALSVICQANQAYLSSQPLRFGDNPGIARQGTLAPARTIC